MAHQSTPVRPALQGHGILPGCSAQPSRSPLLPPRSSRPVARTRTPRRPRRAPTRRRAPTTTRPASVPAQGTRGREPRRAPGQGRRLPEPAVRHRAARRHGGGSSSSSRRGRSWSCAAASPWPSPSWTSARRSPPAASRACSRWPSRPDYAQSGLFYVYYTEKSGSEAIWEYHRASEDSADPGSARLVLRMDDPEPNHNGGLMVFGPDKLMYVGTGDGGGGNDQHGARGNAQSLSSPLGKILRIDPRAVGRAAVHDPVVEPVRRARGRRAARSTPTACATRGASPSTAPTATSSSATSARTRSRRSTSSRRGGARGDELRLAPLGGPAAQLRRARARARCSPSSRTATRPASARSRAATSCATAACPGCTAATCTATSATAHLRVATLHAGRASTRTLSVPAISGVSSFGEDAAGRVYVTSLNGPVYRFAAR